MKISVVIPVRNEEKSIRLLLDGLLKQTLQPTEIVITDGGSTDSTRTIINDYMNRGVPLQLICEQAALPGRGRNVAATRACSEWLAFTDAGIQPAINWLSALAIKALEAPDTDVVYGSWEPVTDTFFKECAAIAYVMPPVETGQKFMRNRFIASSLVRRKLWLEVDGFPEGLRSAEDILFMDRIERLSRRIAYAPDAVVRWDIKPNFRGTFRRFASYSRHNIRAGLWRQWQKPILIRYALIVLSLPLVIVFGRLWLLILLVCWIAMLGFRALVALARNRRAYPARVWRNLLRLPVIMSIIATLDVATLVGTLNWLIVDKVGLAPLVSD